MSIFRAVGLWLSLFLTWLAFSGHYSVFLVAVGAACSLFCVVVAVRMGTVDEEGVPMHLLGKRFGMGFVSYFLWLTWEIIKSAWSVTKIILHPRLPISPTMTRVVAGQKTAVGAAIYANSITLTPGTITVAEDHDAPHPGNAGQTRRCLLIHALVEAGANDLEAGQMDARVSKFEGAA